SRQTHTLCLSGGSPELRQGGPDAGFGGLTQHQRNATRTYATQQEPVGGPPAIVRSTRASTATKRGTQHQDVRSDPRLVTCGQRRRSTRCKHNLTRNGGTHHLQLTQLDAATHPIRPCNSPTFALCSSSRAINTARLFLVWHSYGGKEAGS